MFMAMDYSGRMSETITVSVTNIDTNAPASAPEIIVSHSGWTNSDVTLLLGEVAAAVGESPETRQYQIGTQGWAGLYRCIAF